MSVWAHVGVVAKAGQMRKLSFWQTRREMHEQRSERGSLSVSNSSSVCNPSMIIFCLGKLSTMLSRLGRSLSSVKA